MNSAAECVVVIPCLNEGRTILSLVESVRAVIRNVIVVDDGSDDATAMLAAKAGAEVIRHERPRGKGVALDVGWRRAVGRKFAWALSMDGDGQHSADDIPTFLSAAIGGEADLLVGNRFGNAGSMPWLRREVNRWMSRRLSQRAGIPFPDSQCGFRLMRLDAWSTLTLQADHFEIESEMLLEFIAKGFEVRFVPVRTIYGTERSKINPIWDTWRWFRWWRRVGGRVEKQRHHRSVAVADQRMATANQDVKICLKAPPRSPSPREEGQGDGGCYYKLSHIF